MMAFFTILLLCQYRDEVTVISTNAYETSCQVFFSQENRDNLLPLTRFVVSESTPVCDYTISTSEQTQYAPDGAFLPNTPIVVGHPFAVGSQRLYPLHMYPNYFNNNTKITVKEIKIRVVTPKVKENSTMPAPLYQAFKNLIINKENITPALPQGYLIIVPDAMYNEVLPLALWKEKKGWHVTVATLSQTGSTPVAIKSYITNAMNDSITPEYILLIGDHEQLPAYSTTAPVRHTDHPYTLIYGNDYFSDVLIGRLPAANTTELSTMVAKIIGYESDPYIADPSWFNRALLVAANYPIGIMTTPIPTKRLIRERMLAFGFNEVDTVYYPPTSGGAEITASVNQGVVFVNYRGGDADPDGWIHPSYHIPEVTGLSNGWKLPIVTSIVCLNGFFGVTCFGEAWLRAGNQVIPRGAVAFFGASAATTSSRWNNCLDMGIYRGILKEEITSLASAMYRGKLEVFMNFPLDTTWISGTSFYFHTYNLLGDPSLDMWTHMSQDSFVVTHPSSLPTGSSIMDITWSGVQTEDVLVSLYKDSEVKAVTYTDNNAASLTFQAITPGTLFVTISKPNYRPFLGNCIIMNSNVYVGHDSHSIDDSGGNNNGEINPGEQIDCTITLRNFGTSTTATNVSAVLQTSSPYVTITDSMKSYGTIAPGDTASASPFSFFIAQNTPHDQQLRFTLSITSSQGNWTAGITLVNNAPHCSFVSKQIMDGNGELEPGETSNMVVTLVNNGGLQGQNTSGYLISLNPAVTVPDANGNFGNIAIDDSATNTGDQFTVSAASSVAPGHPITMSVIVTYGNCTNADTLHFEIIIGELISNEPLGPDAYGYYAYDNTDTGYDECPTYNWIEIDPELGGPGDSLYLENDETKTIALPFTFQYYGNGYNRVSICSNGFIAMDSTWVADLYNWHIKAAGGPPLLIAPFWDDFDPNATDSSGHACFWYDAANHRFIVEYSRMQHLHDPTNPFPAELQTFEVLLHDPQYFPTQTGDGEIVFQYYDITNDDIWHNYTTVGIENYDHTVGLEYTYANEYPDAAAVLVNGRAIKFTTNPPDTFPGIQEHKSGSMNKAITINPNPSKGDVCIVLSLERNAQTGTIQIFDITGRLVRSFHFTHDAIRMTHITWDGKDNTGQQLPQGVYYVRVCSAGEYAHEKIVLLR